MACVADVDICEQRFLKIKGEFPTTAQQVFLKHCSCYRFRRIQSVKLGAESATVLLGRALNNEFILHARDLFKWSD